MPILYQQLIALSKQLIEVVSDLSSKFNLDLGNLQTTLTKVLNKTITSASEYVSSGLVSAISESIKALIVLSISLILFVYFLVDMDKIRETKTNIQKIV